ncbi:spermidine/putrescine ABC transporter substrate-binding protein [Opitutia bacterium ISCC 51]|nr:spermidine/putrescine ABC transporter substrate-binding protein [Opitutae bacterium ISCC 51]QXD27605.1 spermidine/putrescine ABC transporter substrate-binding protein [Opitutae bacterium ISCC 52]
MKHLLFILTALVLVGCAEKKDQLNIFIWSEYLDPEVVADFENQLDCDIVIDHFEEPETMLAKLFAGGDSGYDLVVADHRTITALKNRNILAEIRAEAIPNLKHIDPRFRESDFNPDFKFGVPYHWGTTGLFMRQEPGTSVDETWGLFFDPEKQSGQFLLMDDMRATIGVALIYLGYDVNSTDPQALVKAADLLIETKKRSLGFETSILAKNRVLAKEATASSTYSDHGAKGMNADSETAYFIPREGGLIWVDIWCIPARAPHPELAEKFLNFLNDPQINGQNTTYNQAATPNIPARQYSDPSMLENPAIYPPDDVLDRVQYDVDIGDAAKLYDELWTKIKSK